MEYYTIGFATPQPTLADITYDISGGTVDTISNDPEALSITVELTDADGGER